MALNDYISKFINMFNAHDPSEIKEDRSAVVIDIGSSTIKALYGSCEDEKIIIKSFNKVASPASMNKISYYDEITGEMEALNTKLEILLENFTAESDKLIVSLPDNFSIIKFLALDEIVSEDKLDEIIKKNIEPDLPHPYDKWEIVKDVVDSGEQGMNIIILATLKKNFDQITEFISDNLAEPDYVSTSTFLAHEALYSYLETKKSSSVALINLGNVVTSVSIFKGPRLKFIQNVYTGSYNFTLDIANSQKLSAAEAEAFKKSELFFLPEYAQQQEKVKNYLIIKATFMELARGIFYFFDSYFTKYFEEKIDEIIIYGGGANFKNIEVMLSGILSTPVKKASSIIKCCYEDGSPVEAELVDLCLPMIGAICGGISNESKA